MRRRKASLVDVASRPYAQQLRQQGITRRVLLAQPGDDVAATMRHLAKRVARRQRQREFAERRRMAGPIGISKAVRLGLVSRR
jgi:hypothetical protein